MADSSNKLNTRHAFKAAGNLIKLLPTRTVFMLQYLSPAVTNNGHCGHINEYLSGMLVGLCGFSSFTDSYTGSDGKTHYGITTRKGLFPSTNSGALDSSRYKLRFGDYVHAFMSLVVFAVLVFLDSNTVNCSCPFFGSTGRVPLMVLPPAIGAILGFLFIIFPNKRHRIGYLTEETAHNS